MLKVSVKTYYRVIPPAEYAADLPPGLLHQYLTRSPVASMNCAIRLASAVYAEFCWRELPTLLIYSIQVTMNLMFPFGSILWTLFTYLDRREYPLHMSQLA